MSLIKELKENYEVYKERDPAIRTYWDVLLYPCFHVMRAHRKAHKLWEEGKTFEARLISQRAARKTGIEIHPGAKIGKGFFIDHGTGVVIGETCEIGDNVTLYQGVTLGGTGKEQGKRHPTLEDGVMVSAGAKVLGSIRIGANSKIGAGSVVLKDVPPNCTVVGVPGRVVRMKNKVVPRDTIDQTNLPDPILQDMKVFQRVNNELINRMIAVEEEIRRLQEKNEGGGKISDPAMFADSVHVGTEGRKSADANAEVRYCESAHLKEKHNYEIRPEEREYEEVQDCIFADYI